MGRIGLAFRVFFQALFGKLTAERIAAALEIEAEHVAGDGAGTTEAVGMAAAAQQRQRPNAEQRSDALTLLAALQREARLVDLIQEPLADYSDEQVGAAARDVLRDCRAVLERMFSMAPVLEEAEGAEVETPPQYSNARIRISGSVQGQPPYRGKLIHPGWQASRCDVPKWSGTADDQGVISPAEIEVPA